MSRQLVLVHGRSQQGKDPVALKAEWLDALADGLAKSGLELPIGEQDVRFPFYGDALIERVDGTPDETAASVVVRGGRVDDDEQRFVRAVLVEMQQQTGISDAQLAEVADDEVVERGPLNWGWVQAFLEAVDRFVPYGSGTGIALFTHDVYRYLTDSSIREEIEVGVSAALTPGVETVVVGHSLGTVVTYNLLRREGHLRGWHVPLYVTLGSPLAVTAIRKTLKSLAPIRHPASVTRWFNARDPRDVVALYPLDVRHFPIIPEEPAIENYVEVRNRTENRHGIAGYLDDQQVALRIHDALMA